MTETKDENKALAFAEKLLGTAIDIVGAAKVEVTKNSARDPRLIALALLCRTITNFKGAMIAAHEDLIVESRTLTRCCFENLIWIGALRERGADFVKEMVDDEAANKRVLGEMTLKLSSRAGASVNDEPAQILRGHIKNLSKNFPDPKKLHVNKTTEQGVVEIAYIDYARLSLDSVHPSISALRRHLRWIQEVNRHTLMLDVVPPARPGEFFDTIKIACDALLGVSIGTNEILEATEVSNALRAIYDEYDAIFRS